MCKHGQAAQVTGVKLIMSMTLKRRGRLVETAAVETDLVATDDRPSEGLRGRLSGGAPIEPAPALAAQDGALMAKDS